MPYPRLAKKFLRDSQKRERIPKEHKAQVSFEKENLDTQQFGAEMNLQGHLILGWHMMSLSCSYSRQTLLINDLSLPAEFESNLTTYSLALQEVTTYCEMKLCPEMKE